MYKLRGTKMSLCCQKCCHYYCGNCERNCAASLPQCDDAVYICFKDEFGTIVTCRSTHFSNLNDVSFKIYTDIGTISVRGTPKEICTEYTTYNIFDSLQGKSIYIDDLLDRIFDYWVYTIPSPYCIKRTTWSKDKIYPDFVGFLSKDELTALNTFRKIELAKADAKKKEAMVKAEEVRLKNKEQDTKYSEAMERELLAQENKVKEEQLKIKLNTNKNRLIIEMNKTRSIILAVSIMASVIGAMLIIANIGMMNPVLWWVFAAICACGICASIGCTVAFPKRYPTPEQIECGVVSKDDKQEK